MPTCYSCGSWYSDSEWDNLSEDEWFKKFEIIDEKGLNEKIFDCGNEELHEKVNRDCEFQMELSNSVDEEL